MKKIFALLALLASNLTSAQQVENYDYFSANRELVRNGVQAILMCNGLFTSNRSLEQAFEKELAYLPEPIGTPTGGDYSVDWGRQAVAIGSENYVPTMRAAPTFGASPSDDTPAAPGGDSTIAM